MKKKAGFWTVAGIAIGTGISIASKNIPAGLFIGAGTAMLLMIVTNLEVDRKIRN
jgi:hypothetical protein